MLPRKYRLPLGKNAQFEGKKQRFDFFDLITRPNGEKRPRFAVVVASKIVKKAVTRNRTKRLIFKAFENLLGQIDNVDLLVIVKKDLGQFKSQEATLFLREGLVHTGVIK